jgi:uncharacterized membrane protein YbhN (UPF0104 family)
MDESRTADAQAINRSAKRRIPVRSISLAIVVTVALYVGMATLADWKAFGAAVSALPGLLWVQVVALALLSYLLRFARWHHFTVALGHKIPVLRNLEIYLGAFALTLTPGKAGETIRSVYLYPHGVSYPQSIGAFISERVLDLIAVGAIASMAMTFFTDQRSIIIVVVGGVTALLLLLHSRLIGLVLRRFESVPIVGQGAKTITTVYQLLSGRHLFLATILSLLAWMAQGISLYLIVCALGYELPLNFVAAIYCLSILAGAASFIPGGLGATEAAIVLLLSNAGVGQIEAIAASIVCRGSTLFLAIGIGCTAMMKIASFPSPKS